MTSQRNAHSQATAAAPADMRARLRPISMAALYALVVLAALWIWWPSHDKVTRLPEPERRALYQRTLGTLTTFCNPSKDLTGLHDYCQQQADLVVQFPECDAACRAVAQKHRPLPSK